MKTILIYSIIILLILFLIFLFSILLSTLVFSNNYIKVNHELLTKNEVDNLYLLMYKLDKICKKFNIEYFIIAGSLLGAYRHKGLMPWDDDIDIGIMEKYQTILESDEFKNELDKNNMIISKPLSISFGYKIFIKNKEFPFIDIFIYTKENNKIIFKYDYPKNQWPNEYFYYNELYPLKKYNFGNLQLYGPNQSKNYLKRSYGWTCFYFIINMHNHTNKFYYKFKPLLKREVVYPTFPNYNIEFL